jgi:hypothetical protein
MDAPYFIYDGWLQFIIDLMDTCFHSCWAPCNLELRWPYTFLYPRPLVMDYGLMSRAHVMLDVPLQYASDILYSLQTVLILSLSVVLISELYLLVEAMMTT